MEYLLVFYVVGLCGFDLVGWDCLEGVVEGFCEVGVIDEC